ncbi:hypothetical protein ACHAXA_002462 [Cyclostephanos tholiformis]|uniref:Uncharacterized protein n=1 Tax=Cyclostephanos tholiformis TaxID=382380 RepID=A0ABD3RCS4_9STRA
MTAIKTTPTDKASYQDGVLSATVLDIPPSATEEDAKTRYISALSKGVNTLLGRGHGRERASTQLLNEIAHGCAPDEDEIFQTMKMLGISLEDATKVMTVSVAFRKACQGRSTIEAIDELTSRLNLASLLRGNASSRSSSPTPSTTAHVVPLTPGGAKSTEDSFQSRPPATSAITCQRPPRSCKGQTQHQGMGKKRVLAEKTPEKRDGNVMIEEKPNGKASAAADLEVKEKILNAKLSMGEVGKKPKSSSTGATRSKSPEGGLGTRGKRASTTVASHHVEDAQSTKKIRTRSQTEETVSV